MSSPVDGVEGVDTAPPAGSPVVRRLLGSRSFSPSTTAALLGGLTMVMLAAARMFTHAPALTSSGAFGSAIGLATPVAMAGLGGLISERVGIVNIGLQGMMAFGTWGAGFFGWHFGPWGALFGGALMGGLGGALHALTTITFGVDHAVSGVALNLLAPGVCRFLSSVLFAGRDGGTLTDSPPVGHLGRLTLPFVAGGRIGGWHSPDPLGWFEKRQWFLVSDVTGLLRGFTRDIAAETLLMLLLIPLFAYLIWRTPFGLRLRSSGEKPSAADSLGVDVIRIRWTAVILSGMLSGLGGAWLVTNVGKYQQGQEGLRGFLGLGAVIFGNWRPAGMFVGALLFQFTESVRLQIGDAPARAFVLTVAFALAALAVWQLGRRAITAGSVLIASAIGVFAYYAVANRVDDKLAYTFPFLITLLMLLFSSERLRPPAASGQPFFKGSS